MGGARFQLRRGYSTPQLTVQLGSSAGSLSSQKVFLERLAGGEEEVVIATGRDLGKGGQRGRTREQGSLAIS